MCRRWMGLCVTLGLFACGEDAGGLLGGDDQDREEAEQAVESTDLSGIESALLAAAAQDTPLGQEPAQMATAVAAAAETTFTPADCVQAEAAAATVTFTFDGCSGPRGLRNLSGIANIVFSVEAATSVAMTLTATNLEVNGATLTINSNAAYSVDGTESHVDLTTSGVGTTSDGTIIGRAGTYLVTFDDDCLTIDGTWTSSINDEAFYNTSVEGYRRCGNACPESGRIGYVGVQTPDSTVDPFAGSGIIITFDGDDSAGFVSPSPATGSIPLDC